MRPGAVALAFTLAACSSLPNEPYYYYNSKPIYLQVDPGRLVVASTVLTSAQAVSAVVASNNVQVVSVDSLSQEPGHWVVHLASSTSITGAYGAVHGLRADWRIMFASTAFWTVEGHHDFIPLDRLGVIFNPGVSQTQIDSLNAAFGTSIIRPPIPEWGIPEFWLAYPRGADFLSVAAAYARSPLVRLADPDRISDATLD